jgi:hypothetical protein
MNGLPMNDILCELDRLEKSLAFDDDTTLEEMAINVDEARTAIQSILKRYSGAV